MNGTGYGAQPAVKVRLRDGTGERQYKFTTEDVDRHGNVRIYFRRKGKAKIRLREAPGTQAFEEEYRRAFNGETSGRVAAVGNRTPPAAPGTMRWLCEQYYASAKFQALGESTRKVRRSILDTICNRAGSFRFAMMRPQDVARLRDEKAKTPEAANARVKALRQVFAWACDPEYKIATQNPAREVRYLSGENPDGFKAWSEEDVARYEARHPIGTKARLALDLLLYTGARRSDVVRLGPQMERDGKLIFNEVKGSRRIAKRHELLILPPLRRSIDATPTGHLVYLATAFGRPHSVKAFGNWFKRRCREAELEDLSAHGLRKLAAQRCAEAGASEHQLMALFGWTSTKQAALYTRRANRAKLEAEAALLLEGQTRNNDVPPFPVASSGGTRRGKKS